MSACPCPYCGGEISDTALKCRHCREWVRPIPPPPAPTAAAQANTPGAPEPAVATAPPTVAATSLPRLGYGQLEASFQSSVPPVRPRSGLLTAQIGMAVLGIVLLLILRYVVFEPYEDAVTKALEAGAEAPPIAAEPIEYPFEGIELPSP